MVTIIPNRVEKIWETWNVRGVLLLSFFIQMILVLFAPSRKRSDNMLLRFAIWSAYLLADSTASFGLGLITSNNGNRNGVAQDKLLALWAPFLLLHFGGADAITAFNLEDNSLWLRQIPGLLFKFVVLAYVFVLTLPQNEIWAPTLLIFVAGIIKYSERTCSLYLASQKISGKQSKESILPNKSECLTRTMLLVKIRAHAQAIQAAYQFNQPPTEIEQLVDEEQLVDMKPLCGELSKYCSEKNFKYLADLSHIEALEVIEVICEFIYAMYYTKASILRNKIACLVRFVAFCSVVVSLGLFTSIEKNGSYKFEKVDLLVTYALFYGALFIETISLFKLIFSEMMATILNESPQNSSFLGNIIKFYLAKALKPILILQRPRWSQCKKTPYTEFKELSTPFLFRKWCCSTSGLNLITICLDQYHPKRKYLHFKLVEILESGFDQIASYFGARELMLSKYKVKSVLILDMWQFIFVDLIIMMPRMGKESTLEQRIRVALNERACLSTEKTNNLMQNFLKYNNGQEDHGFDGIVILWHVSTDLCYANDEHHGGNKRHFIKLLSNYMLYLLLMQPNIISEVLGTEQEWFRKTCIDVITIFSEEGFISDHESIDEVCKRLHERATELPDRYLLDDACRLAEHLNNQFSQDKKWEVIGIIWVQMLTHVAVKCRPSIHVKLLSQGGGLISLVWLASLLL